MIYRQLYKVVDDYKKQISKTDVYDVRFAGLSIEFLESIIENCRSIDWEDLSGLEQHKVKHLLFDWLEEMKQVTILIRDVHLKANRNLFELEEGFITDEVFSIELESSIGLMNQALEELYDKLVEIENLEKINQDLKEKWYHHISPLNEYLDQLETLKEQIKTIQESRGNLLIVAHDIKINKLAVQDQLEYFTNSIQQVINKAKEVLRLIEVSNNIADTKELNYILSFLKEFSDELQEHKVKVLSQQADINTLEKVKIPSFVENGQLVIKEINFQTHIRQWLEEELFPTLLDITRLDELIHEKGIVATMNTRSRLELLTMEMKEEQIVPKSMLSVPMRQFFNEAEHIFKEIKQHTAKLQYRISQEYLLSLIYSKEFLFLKDNVEFSLVDYRRKKSRKPIIDFKKLSKRYNEFSKKYLPDLNWERTNKMDIIQFVNHNRLPELDQFSQSLFLKKGYIGNSFMMPRNDFEEIARSNYHNWEQGFRGSILVVGDRLSGRSSVLESVPHILQETTSINIAPNSEIRFKGRKHQTENDLIGTLDFIYKNSISDRVIITIDDFEMWRSKDHSALNTAKSIAEKFNRYSRKLMLVMSMNHHIKDKLDSYIQFSDLFLSEYCTDRMDREDIVKSLLIRHSASLREMTVDTETQELNESELRSLARKVAKKSDLNIGSSLKNWSRFIFYQKENQTDIKSPPQSFVNLINEHGHILSHFLRYTVTNENELREMIGTNYIREFADDLQVLLSYQILVRDRNSNIYINEALVQYVEEVILKAHLTPNVIQYV